MGWSAMCDITVVFPDLTHFLSYMILVYAYFNINILTTNLIISETNRKEKINL